MATVEVIVGIGLLMFPFLASYIEAKKESDQRKDALKKSRPWWD